MSFPQIPDIEPNIKITLEDATNLLLLSIALEEISLSKLIDAETDKVLFTINECEHRVSGHQNVLDINKSVNETLKNIIKLQMLLQFKLEKVNELTTTTTSTTTTTTSTSTTTTHTTTHTTTSTTSTCSTTTKKHCQCSLIGKRNGSITNSLDEFFCNTAVIKAFITCYDIKSRSLTYTVQNETTKFRMYADACNINIECYTDNPDKILIYGKGYVEKEFINNQKVCGYANFKLSVWHPDLDCINFKMVIKSYSNPELSHNSGIVEIINLNSHLYLGNVF